MEWVIEVTFPTGRGIFICVTALRLDLGTTLLPSQQIRRYIPRGRAVEAYLSPAPSIEVINAQDYPFTSSHAVQSLVLKYF